MIGTQKAVLMVRNTSVMIRVGGGFETLEGYIRQNGPFECIKIYKMMRGDEAHHEHAMTFKDAVAKSLQKLRTPEKIISNWLATPEDEQIELFSNAIQYLKAKSDEKNKQWHADRGRRGTVTDRGTGGSPRGNAGSPSGASPRQVAGGASPRANGPSPKRAGGPSPPRRGGLGAAGASPRGSTVVKRNAYQGGGAGRSPRGRF